LPDRADQRVVATLPFEVVRVRIADNVVVSVSAGHIFWTCLERQLTIETCVILDTYWGSASSGFGYEEYGGHRWESEH
jgi:hypothetical protein